MGDGPCRKHNAIIGRAAELLCQGVCEKPPPQRPSRADQAAIGDLEDVIPDFSKLDVDRSVSLLQWVTLAGGTSSAGVASAPPMHRFSRA